MSNETNKLLPWAGHPRGLPTLFFLEAWERFSYYGMKAILVLYLVTEAAKGGMGLEEGKAYAMAAVYSSLVYLSPLFGGWIADRWLKPRKAVFLGGIMIMAGHFSLAVQTAFSFKLGLAFLIIGNGLFKPNVSAMVGELYPEGDPRKEGGFSIFYSGINWGALLGIFICGYLGEKVSWHLGFGAAGVAMLLGLIVVFRRQYTLERAGLPEGKRVLDEGDMAHVLKLALLCVIVGVVCIVGLPLLAVLYDPMKAITGHDSDKVKVLFMWRLPLALALVWLVKVVFKDKQNSDVFEEAAPGAPFYGLGVFLATVAFFGVALGLGQTDGILTVFAKDRIDLNIGSWQFPASWVQNLNPILVVVLAPLFARIWEKVRINDFGKQALGLFMLTASFMLVGEAFAHSNSLLHAADMQAGVPGAPRIPILWLFGPYLMLTTAELCISPIGLALVQKISPRRVVSLMFAIYFLGSFAANTIANPIVTNFKGRETVLFGILWKSSLAMGVVWIGISLLVKLMNGPREQLKR